MFSDETEDGVMVVMHLFLGAAMFVPFLLIYLNLNNSGVATDAHLNLFIGAIICVVSFIIFAIGSTESAIESESGYTVASIIGIIAWIIGSIVVLTCFTGDSNQVFFKTVEVNTTTDKWFCILGLLPMAASGYSVISCMLKSIELIHNGIHNIISIAVCVLFFVLAVIFVFNGLYGAFRVLAYISFIPMAIELVTIVVSFFKG